MIEEREYRILHLEDLPSDAELVEREIKKNLENYSIHLVETEADFINELEEYKPHIVISDFQLPSFNGLSALKIVLEKTPITPVIILTGSMNEDTAVECMKAGAVDYVIKEHLKRLGPAILNALEQKEIKIERLRTEKQILLLSKSIEQSPVSVIITNPDGKIIYINKQFSELTGFSSDETIGKKPSILKSGKQSKVFYEKMWETILTGASWKGEMCNKRKNGDLYWESVSISSIVDEKGEILNFIGIKEDISEKKKNLEDLEIAKNRAEESDRLKSAFLANMSHEIRTPMNGILGFADLLKKPNLTEEKQQSFIKIIHESGQRMLDTINNIVDISKIEAGLMSTNITKSNVNLQMDYLYEFFKPMAKSKGLQLSINKGLPSNEADIDTDKEKFTSILTNLVGNAIKYTNEGSIELGYSKKEEHLEFCIKDTGIGIPRDRLEAIFDRFTQADIKDTHAFQGSGLGLTISKSYIEMLGGIVWVESEEGLGSAFYFTLPHNVLLEEKNKIKNTVQAIEKEGEIQNIKVLIAEDDEVSSMFITEVISEINTEIIYAKNGLEAVELCNNNSDIDLVLMDIRMPFMDGLEATRQIRLFNKDVIIIAQTAYGLSGDKEKSINAGCNEYITKPIDPTLLFELIEKYYKKSRPSD